MNFTANLEQDGNAKIFLVVEEAKETVLDFSQGKYYKSGKVL